MFLFLYYYSHFIYIIRFPAHPLTFLSEEEDGNKITQKCGNCLKNSKITGANNKHLKTLILRKVPGYFMIKERERVSERSIFRFI